MKVFISWSGDQALAVAETLRDWLPEVLQELEPWISSQDLRKGEMWYSTLMGELTETSQGIICLTPSSLEAPWLYYEAGALSKSVPEKAQIHPFLVGVSRDLVTGPLSGWNGTVGTDEDEVLKMLKALNQAMENPQPDDRVERQFRRTWPELEQKLIRAQDAEAAPPPRNRDDILLEVLERVRALGSRLDAIDRVAGAPGAWHDRTQTIARAREHARDFDRREPPFHLDGSPGTRLYHKDYGYGIVTEPLPGAHMVIFDGEETERRVSHPNPRVSGVLPGQYTSGS